MATTLKPYKNQSRRYWTYIDTQFLLLVFHMCFKLKAYLNINKEQIYVIYTLPYMEHLAIPLHRDKHVKHYISVWDNI